MMESATPQTTPGPAPLVPSDARDAAQIDDARTWPRPRALALVGVVLLIGAIPVFQSMINHDVAWILYIADRVLHGSTLYKDIVEINPPLIVWLNIPIVALAHLVGASSIVVFRVVVLALIAGSLALSVRIIGPLNGADGADWVIMLLAACFALVAFPGYDFGQREHLLLILALPYVLLTVARARGRVPTAALAIGVGIAAGVGLAIKPFFLTLWIGLIAYAWATEKRLPWRRPEVLASGAVIVLYGIAVVLFAPQYFGLVRTFAPLYRTFDDHSYLFVLFKLWPALAALLAWAVLRREWGWRHVSDVLAIVVVALICSAVVQRKGWTYHRYPAQATALLLVVSLALAPLRRVLRDVRVRPLLFAVAFAAFIGRAAVSGGYTDPMRPRTLVNILAPVVRQYAKGGSIVVLSENIFPGFPLVNYTGTTWASRYCCQWFVQAMYPDAFWRRPGTVPRPGEHMTPLENSLIHSVVDDLLRYHPRMIIAYRGPIVDYLRYYAHDPRFLHLLASYRHAGNAGRFDVWVLRDSTTQ